MATVYLTCDSSGITVTDGVPHCSTGWVMSEPFVPELTAGDMASIMSATLLFFAICFGGRSIANLLDGPTSES